MNNPAPYTIVKHPEAIGKVFFKQLFCNYYVQADTLNGIFEYILLKYCSEPEFCIESFWVFEKTEHGPDFIEWEQFLDNDQFGMLMEVRKENHRISMEAFNR